MKLYKGTVESCDKITMNNGDILYKVGLVVDRKCSEFGVTHVEIYMKSYPKQGDVLHILPSGGKWKRVEV